MKVEDLRPSVIRIKRALRDGIVVLRERQSGKTTALLEFVHEHDPGNVNVIVCDLNTAHFMKCRYKETYPNDPQPSFISVQNVSDTDVRGTKRNWVTDEVWPEAVIRKAQDYEYVPFLGGVGTAMCMERFSGVFLTGFQEEKPESRKPVFMQMSDGRKKP